MYRFGIGSEVCFDTMADNVLYLHTVYTSRVGYYGIGKAIFNHTEFII